MNDFAFAKQVVLVRKSPRRMYFRRSSIGGFGCFPLGLPKGKKLAETSSGEKARVVIHGSRKVTGQTVVIHGLAQSWKSSWYVKWVMDAIVHEDVHRVLFHTVGYDTGLALDTFSGLKSLY